MIGQIGAVTFEVRPGLVRTYQEYSESDQARLGEHEVGGAYPTIEFIGPGVTTRSVPVVLNSALGVDVEGDASTLQGYCRGGVLLTVVMGGQVVGGPGAQWILETVDVERQEQNRAGVCVLAVASLGLKLARTSGQAASAPSTVTKANVRQVSV